ncbi:MAG: DUF5615 family PIN-like protein [Thermodesulfobacteriota bacterium]
MNPHQLKFLVDVGVGKKVEEYLQNEGYDTKAVRDLDPSMEDKKIVVLANDENRMVITMDKDFGELVYHSAMGHRGILLLRLEDATGDEKLGAVREILKCYSDRMIGCFCVLQKDKFRIRKMDYKK